MSDHDTIADLVLTPLMDDDAPRLHEWRRDPEILNGALGYPFPASLAAELDWIRSFSPRGTPQDICLAVRQEPGGELLGYCMLRGIDWISRVAEFGIVIGPQARGMGVGSRALKLVQSYATHDLSLRKLWLRVAEYNERAISMYASAGFVPEGRLKRHAYRRGCLHDILLFGWETPAGKEPLGN